MPAISCQTANAFGGLDFVWNHVDHPGPAATEGIDMADVDIAINLNLRTVLVTTEAAIPEIRARGGGALLYAASTSGLVGLGVQSGLFNGEIRCGRFLSGRLPNGWLPITSGVNAVCSGPIDTPMLRVFVARQDQQQAPGEGDKEALIVGRSQANSDEAHRQPGGDRQPVLLLLSGEASFVSGAALPVGGGATAQINTQIGSDDGVHPEHD